LASRPRSRALGRDYTFVNPIIAVGLGWAVLGEHLTVQMLAGFSLIVVSVVTVWRLEAFAPIDRA
jgi:drug/metabolite transporter (DMT)-like permease